MLVGLNDKDLLQCDYIVNELNEKPLLGSNKIIVIKIIEKNEIENRLARKYEISSTVAPSSVPRDNLLKNELKKLLDDKICKKCGEREKEIMFLPCSHLLYCMICSKSDYCPICMKKIEAQIKVFL